MKTILIIDDDDFLREIISKKFSGENFSVKEAVNGKEGIKKAKEEKPDLILLDLILPETDGFEILQILKTEPETSSIPVIVTSCLNQKEDVDKAMKIGAADFIVKTNLKLDQMAEKVKNILK